MTFIFAGALEGQALQSEAQMKLLFLDIETTMKIKLGFIFEQLTEVRNRRGHTRTFDMS